MKNRTPETAASNGTKKTNGSENREAARPARLSATSNAPDVPEVDRLLWQVDAVTLELDLIADALMPGEIGPENAAVLLRDISRRLGETRDAIEIASALQTPAVNS